LQTSSVIVVLVNHPDVEAAILARILQAELSLLDFSGLL
jgi:hypothetical protein